MLCPLYMAEISPPEFRGALMAMEQFSIVLGCVLGFWTGFFTRGGMSLPSPLHLPPGCALMMTFSHIQPPYNTPQIRALRRPCMPANSFVGFLFCSGIPRCIHRNPVLCPFPVSTFFSGETSQWIRFVEDSPRGSVDPRDRACDRVHFLTSVPEAPRCTGAQ